jgi:flagellar hook assembly protein FlgD
MNVNLSDGTIITYEITDIRKIDFSNITSLEDAQKISHIIKTFKVMQNYPNPFNPTTTIEYEIPIGGNVQILIFDINGRLIKTIENSHKLAGIHEVIWDGQNESIR